jgi:MarR family transcriptional regulator, transcriptional regulator for hemolysin
MTDEDGSPSINIGLRLAVVARLLRQDFDRHASDIGVTRSQWAMIVVVARHPGATQRTIAELMEMSEASAGRLIDRLCADGLLERRARDDDRRARAVYVTPAAEPLLARLSELAQAGEERVFRGFDRAELDALRGYLDRINANIAP